MQYGNYQGNPNSNALATAPHAYNPAVNPSAQGLNPHAMYNQANNMQNPMINPTTSMTMPSPMTFNQNSMQNQLNSNQNAILNQANIPQGVNPSVQTSGTLNEPNISINMVNNNPNNGIIQGNMQPIATDSVHLNIN